MQLTSGNFWREFATEGREKHGMRRRNVQVFVSYTWTKNGSNAVTKFTKDLATKLKADKDFQDPTVFQDINTIPNDANEARLKADLGAALKKSDVLVVLVSGAWFRSKWCHWEFTEFNKVKQDKSLRIVQVPWWETGALTAEQREIEKQLADEKQNMSPADRKILELAIAVVEGIPKKDRLLAEKDPDDRNRIRSADHQKNKRLSPNTTKTPPYKSPRA